MQICKALSVREFAYNFVSEFAHTFCEWMHFQENAVMGLSEIGRRQKSGLETALVEQMFYGAFERAGSHWRAAATGP
jgi:hypothetical protein